MQSLKKKQKYLLYTIQTSCLLWRFYNRYSSKEKGNSLWIKNTTQKYDIITAFWKTTLSKQLYTTFKNNKRHKGSWWTSITFSSEVINFEYFAQISIITMFFIKLIKVHNLNCSKVKHTNTIFMLCNEIEINKSECVT